MSLQNLEKWASENEVTLISYGSRKNDLDYMLFKSKDIKFPADELFPRSLKTGGDQGFLICSEEGLIDISINEWPHKKEDDFWIRCDMLRNSEPQPIYISDKLSAKKVIDEFIASHDRKKMTDKEILAKVQWAYINLLFTDKKVASGALHGRWLLIHCIEPTLIELARQYNLRQGGKGKWKGRDVEKTLTPGQYTMTALNIPLQTEKQLEVCINVRACFRFWLNELQIPIPYYLL